MCICNKNKNAIHTHTPQTFPAYKPDLWHIRQQKPQERVQPTIHPVNVTPVPIQINIDTKPVIVVPVQNNITVPIQKFNTHIVPFRTPNVPVMPVKLPVSPIKTPIVASRTPFYPTHSKPTIVIPTINPLPAPAKISIPQNKPIIPIQNNLRQVNNTTTRTVNLSIPARQIPLPKPYSLQNHQILLANRISAANRKK